MSAAAPPSRFGRALVAVWLILVVCQATARQIMAADWPESLIAGSPVIINSEIRSAEFQRPAPFAPDEPHVAGSVNRDRFGDSLLGPQESPIQLTAGQSPSTAAAPSDVIARPWAAMSAALTRAMRGPTPPPIRFTDDAWCFIPRLGHDAMGLVNWNDAAILGVALGGSLAIRSELDGPVRNWTAEHPDRWGESSRIIGNFGVAQYQVPVILGAYAYTVYAQNYYQHDMMCSLISAYTLTGLSTVVIKGIADTDRPSDQWNGGKYGFPSYHTASMFSISAVLDEYEGHLVGVPMYIFSGLIGFARIDTRDHDLSDVVFGAVMGYVIGKSVAGKALYDDSHVHILPYVHPTDGSPGIMLDARF